MPANGIPNIFDLETPREAFTLERRDKPGDFVGWDVTALKAMVKHGHRGCLHIGKWRAFIKAEGIAIDDEYADGWDLENAEDVLVVYYLDANGKLRWACADGNHRMRKAEKSGWVCFRAVRFDYALAGTVALTQDQCKMARAGQPWWRQPGMDFAAKLIGKETDAAKVIMYGPVPLERPLSDWIAGHTQVRAYNAAGELIPTLCGELSDGLLESLKAAAGPPTKWYGMKPPGFPGVFLGAWQGHIV